MIKYLCNSSLYFPTCIVESFFLKTQKEWSNYISILARFEDIARHTNKVWVEQNKSDRALWDICHFIPQSRLAVFEKFNNRFYNLRLRKIKNVELIENLFTLPLSQTLVLNCQPCKPSTWRISVSCSYEFPHTPNKSWFLSAFKESYV